MSSYTINPKDYIRRDMEEYKLAKKIDEYDTKGIKNPKLENDLSSLMEEHRGIIYNKDDMSIDYFTFTRYMLKRCTMFCISKNTYYAYNKKLHYYQIINENTIKKIIHVIFDEYNKELYELYYGRNIYEAFKETIPETNELSVTSGVIVFANGTLYTNINSHKPMEFTNKFSSKNVVLSAMPYNYDPEAQCPKFQQFLKECLKGDESLKKLLRDCCSNIFAFGEAYIHHIVFLYGTGRNGKSVFLDIIKYLFPGICSHARLDNIAKQFGTSKLVGKVLNISSETGLKISSTETIKEITAGSPTEAEFKHKDSFPIRITTKLFASTNSLPYTLDNSKGWEERLTIIPFEEHFEQLPENGIKKKGILYQNPYMLEELQEEREGIAAWLLEGLEELKQRDWKLSSCERSYKYKQMVIMEQQPVRLFFNSCIEKCSQKDKACTKTSEIHRAFNSWTGHNDIKQFIFNNSRDFHKEFRRVLEINGCSPAPKEIHGYQYYTGIVLKKDYRKFVCYI